MNKTGTASVVTVKDIAKRAGVSRAAVSKALNDKSDISISVKKKIRKIANEMGYVANVAAKTLSTRKTGTIGVLVGFPQIPTVAERILGVQDCAMQKNYLCMISFHDGKMANEINQVKMLKGRIDGLIITPINQSRDLVKNIKELNVPVVLMNEALPGLDTDYVGDDDEHGGYIGALHFIEAAGGHMAYLGNRTDCPSDLAVIRGIRRAFEKKNIPDSLHVLWGNADQNDVNRNIDILIKDFSGIKGIFCFNDMTALWAMQYLDRQGVNVPSQMKVMGYDDISFAAMARVPLTSISQPNRQIGVQSAMVLFDRMEAPATYDHPKKIIFSPTLVIRDSSC